MKKKNTRHELTGTIQSYNLSPKGLREGLLLETDEGVNQVNFPPEFGAVIAQAAAVGARVTVSAEPDDDDRPRNHPVYDLVELITEDGRRLNPDGPSEETQTRIEGVVARLNFARHGEPNGAILDSGDFIHLRPQGARDVDLAVGQHLVAEGELRPAAGGHRVLEAMLVNGISIGKPAKKKAGKKKKK